MFTAVRFRYLSSWVSSQSCLQNIHIALDDSIGGTIGTLVPAISRTDLDLGAREHALHFLDLGKKLIAGEVAAVKSL